VRGHWFVLPVELSVAGSAQEYSREMFCGNLKSATPRLVALALLPVRSGTQGKVYRRSEVRKR
jgi:hypothetical protein